MIIQEFNSEFEGMNEFDHRISLLLKQHRGMPKKFRPERGFEPCEPCDAAPVLHRFSYQANWEQVGVKVDYKPLDVGIDDVNTGIFHLFEMRIGMNECCILNTRKIPMLSSPISTSTGL